MSLVARLLLPFVCVLLALPAERRFPGGVAWDQMYSQFTWWRGEVTLPLGLMLQGTPSDTFQGQFHSRDGKRVIRFDIGYYAGAYAGRRDADSFAEWKVDGARVWVAKRKWGRGGALTAVTFPDSDCANFLLESHGAGDDAVVDGIARSFHPKGGVPSPSQCGQGE